MLKLFQAAQARFQALNDVRRQSLQLQVRAVLQAGLKVINDGTCE